MSTPEDVAARPDNRLRNIRLVRQEDANGCLVACLAMVTGRTYAEVKAAFPREDVAHGGLNHYHVFDYLTDAGFAFTRIQKYRWSGEHKERDEWPVSFDADTAICWVDAGLGGEHTHGMVAMRDGCVFDPIHGERRWADYSKFGAIMPLYDRTALASQRATIERLERERDAAVFNVAGLRFLLLEARPHVGDVRVCCGIGIQHVHDEPPECCAEPDNLGDLIDAALEEPAQT